MKSVNGWTEDKIVELLKTSDKAIEHALVRLFERQTSSEQSSESTHVYNNRGFRPCDAEYFSSLAKQILAGKIARDAAPGLHLSPKQIFHCRKGTKRDPNMPRLGVYRRQLLECIAEKPAATAPAPKPQSDHMTGLPVATKVELSYVAGADIDADAKHFGFSKERWFDMINAMDQAEYRDFIGRLESHKAIA